MPVGASGGINIYSPTVVRALKKAEILALACDFGNAVKLAKKAGFDCVEIHAGHGYLISQFLSPYTNKRKDEYGGSLENRMKFMKMVMAEVMKAAGNELAVVVKTNMYDGFKGGLMFDECVKIAKELENLGVHALVLTAGFVSKAPMEILRGAMPLKTLAYYMDTLRFWWLKIGLRIVGRLIIPTVPYQEAYFLESAKRFKKELNIPLIYVGGMIAKPKMEEVINEGFVAFQLARPLIHDTDFINKIKTGEIEKSECKHSNYCIGRMYSIEMKCHHCVDHLPKKLEKEIKNNEATKN
jgi:2,4-dienoyl-CoA reductase-like NADH-dependent reductase (Old Yellow Enzyme family)